MITTFTHPRSCAFSTDISIEINGQPVEVLHTEAADFALFVYDASQGPAEVVITRFADLVEGNTIRPRSRKISGEASGKTLRFAIESAEKLCVEIDGLRPIFIWANPPETDKPSEDDPNVRYFKAGQIYELGKFSMEAGQTLYIEGGAVVKGRIHTQHTDNITIRGHGIFDGGYYSSDRGDMVPSILLERCNNVVVRDITMIHPSGWMLVPGACENVEIFNLKQIGEVVCSDGIDVVGSKHVHIDDCFLCNNDDCIVVKAFFLSSNNLTDTHADLRECPEDILVENCTFLSMPAGNALEIGHELSVDRVSDVTFRNIDILNVHGHGAVFSLHNNDRAVIEDILFENIEVEHCWDKFIDFRISESRFSSDDERGHMRNITLRNVNWHQMECNVGYTVSMIGGWDAEHMIEDVKFENCCINGKPIKHIDELEICTRHAKNIRVV